MARTWYDTKNRKTIPDTVKKLLHGELETQARRIVRAFGGVRTFTALVDSYLEVFPDDKEGRVTHENSVYRWFISREKGGRNGVLSVKTLFFVLRVARFHGILLSSEDIDPRPLPPRPRYPDTRVA